MPTYVNHAKNNTFINEKNTVGVVKNPNGKTVYWHYEHNLEAGITLIHEYKSEDYGNYKLFVKAIKSKVAIKEFIKL